MLNPHDIFAVIKHVCLCLSALQSPIEYQRRESKSNSLGRCMRPPLSAASALRPHSSASIDRHKLPSLHSHNTSLPTLYLPSQGQGHGPSETYSLRDVGFFSFVFLCPTYNDTVLQQLPTQTLYFCSQHTHTHNTLHKWNNKNSNVIVCMHYGGD